MKTLIPVVVNDRMMNADDNRLVVYLVPTVEWASAKEWSDYLSMVENATYENEVERQIIVGRFKSRHNVWLSKFERLAKATIVSLADPAPSDEVILANNSAIAEHEDIVDSTLERIVRLPVTRQYGRETRLGEPYRTTPYHLTGYLRTHAEIVKWASSLDLS